MKKIAKWNWLRIIRDWKTRILLALFLIFFGSFSLLYRQQNVTFPAIEMSEEYEDERQIYRLIPKDHFESELGQEVQKALGSNSVALGVNRYILSQRSGNEIQGMDVLPDYIENGREIVENNLFLHSAEDFESHELLVDTYLPPLEEVLEQERFYNELEASGLDIEWNPYTASQMVKVEFELLAGITLFLLIALLAADHFTKDQVENWSATQGWPIPWKTQWRLRSGYLGGLFWLAILIGAGISYLISLQIETSGSFNYPTALFQNGAIHYVPLWQYLIISITMSIALSYILLLITTGLSWIFRNFYLTILLVAGFFLLPQMWSFLPAFSSWQPSLYLNILGVLDGSVAASTGLSGVVWWKGIIIYGVMVLALEWLFSKVFSYIPTATSGLQRREQV
ncbi:MAG TPA: hypothetical protein VK042_00525 [Atopostipes sp.]|nr:hypothetical protein [Atopostipes sp.]